MSSDISTNESTFIRSLHDKKNPYVMIPREIIEWDELPIKTQNELFSVIHSEKGDL